MIPTVRVLHSNPAYPYLDINAEDFDPERHELYVAPDAPPALPMPPPPPPAAFDPLDALPKDWRDAKGRGIAKLREVAAAVSGGRMPENKEEAVQMLDAEIARRLLPPPPPLVE